MFVAVANDGVTVNKTGSSILCSNGETYRFFGRRLSGPNGFVSMNVSDMSEAFGIVLGLHGGRRI